MNKNIYNIIVSSNYSGYRIDKFLQSQISEFSRTRLQNLIHDGQVKLNEVIINSPAKKVNFEDKIKINFPPPIKTEIKPTKLSLEVLYSDDDIIIIKDENGNVYWPEYELNSIGNMCPGNGYRIKTNESVNFSYPSGLYLPEDRFLLNLFLNFLNLQI